MRAMLNATCGHEIQKPQLERQRYGRIPLAEDGIHGHAKVPSIIVLLASRTPKQFSD